MATEPTSEQKIAATLTEVSEHLTVLVREEIELAKAEVSIKLAKFTRGAAVGAVAAVFVVLAFLFGLEGLAWLLWYVLPTGGRANYFWGFFLLAAILVVFAAVAGVVAYRYLGGGPPTASMALHEARQIRGDVRRFTKAVGEAAEKEL